jgi:hypothetical protein
MAFGGSGFVFFPCLFKLNRMWVIYFPYNLKSLFSPLLKVLETSNKESRTAQYQ